MMPPTAAVKDFARALGADLAGIAAAAAFTRAPAHARPAAVLPSCRSVVVLGGAFPPEILAAAPADYTAIRNSITAKMTRLAEDLAARLADQGFAAVPVDALAVQAVPGGRHVGAISLKHAAVLAGLGYIGKNDLLITPRLGNMVWLSAVATSAPLQADAPATGHCPAECRRCIDACPAAALGGPEMERAKCFAHAFKVNDGRPEIQCWHCRSVCPQTAMGNGQ